jgi:hypothetical protein
MKKFGSCPLRSKTLVFPGFFAFLDNCFGFPAYPCMSMPAGAAPVEIVVLCAALDPKNISVSRPVSRQSRPRTLVFQGRTCGFVAEVQDSNSLSSNRSRVHCRNADIEIATRVPRYRMLIHRLATGG